jgi:hypothetical protein
MIKEGVEELGLSPRESRLAVEASLDELDDNRALNLTGIENAVNIKLGGDK